MVDQQVHNAIEITPLKPDEAISLLRKTLSEDLCDTESALELVEALHRSPLAINQTTAYILTRGPEMIMADYRINWNIRQCFIVQYT
jgi:hypothetical protein